MAWMNTIGKHIFGIKHHWLCYEFAPGRGQIHAHMLAITKHIEVLQHYHAIGPTDKEANDTQRQANYLSAWVQSTFQMTACVHKELFRKYKTRTQRQKPIHKNEMNNHPSRIRYIDIHDHDEDYAACQWYLQYHKCSAKCL